MLRINNTYNHITVAALELLVFVVLVLYCLNGVLNQEEIVCSGISNNQQYSVIISRQSDFFNRGRFGIIIKQTELDVGEQKEAEMIFLADGMTSCSLDFHDSYVNVNVSGLDGFPQETRFCRIYWNDLQFV